MDDEKGFYHPDLGYWQTVGGEPSVSDYPEGTVEIPLKPGENYEWVEGDWVHVEPEAPLEPVPVEISRRQFFQNLAVREIITRQEALAAIQTGAIPAALQAMVDDMDTEDDKFNAEMLIAGAQVFTRSNPLTEIVRVKIGWTSEQTDDFWRAAYKM